MPSNCCLFPGCKTGYLSDRNRCKKEDKKVKTLFRVPRDPELLKKWRLVIGLNKDFSKSCVCELHFSEDDIEKFFETRMPDGTINRIERGRVKLKEGAVPRYPTNSPGYLLRKHALSESLAIVQQFEEEEELTPYDTSCDISENCQQNANREQPSYDKSLSTLNLKTFPKPVSRTVQHTEDVDEKPSLEALVQIAENLEKRPLVSHSDILVSYENSVKNENSVPHNFDDSNRELSELFNFKFVLENVDKIKKPSKLWSFAFPSECMICAKWDSNFMPDRRVIIEPDLSIKVFLKGLQIDLPEVRQKVHCLNDVSVLLKEIDEIILCAGVPQTQNRPEESCSLYLHERTSSRGTYSNFCEACRKLKRRKSSGDKSEHESEKYENLKRRFENLSKRNRRSVKRVSSLKARVSALKARIIALRKMCADGGDF